MPYKDIEKRRASSRESARRWRHNHPERSKAVYQRYRKTHAALCTERSKRWRHKNPEKLRIRRLVNRELFNERTRQWRLRNKDKILAKLSEYRQSNPEKRSAHTAIERALKKGRIKKPAFCSQCGAEENTHAHHHKGYAREHWLTVIWLCQSCHNKIHKTIHYGKITAVSIHS